MSLPEEGYYRSLIIKRLGFCNNLLQVGLESKDWASVITFFR
jgi:hypothetical protein